MAKKIYLGKTSFEQLHSILGFLEYDDLELKRAKLFPIGNTEKEIAATSIFLASLSAIKEYREELFSEINVSKIKTKNASVHTYTEMQNPDTKDRPDGLVVITSGKHHPIIEWASFVESKVGNNELDNAQIQRYAEYAKTIGINDIVTISNHLVPNPLHSPVKTTHRSLNLFHWSWMYLKVVATRLIRTNSVQDPDHIFMLTEFRRYLDSNRNMNHYTYMGSKWGESVKKVHSLESNQKIDSTTLDDLVNSYIQEEKDISLQLTDRTELHVELNAKGDRVEEVSKMINESKSIKSTFIINKDKSKIFNIESDFIRQEISCSTTIEISKGKAQSQTSNLLKYFESDSGAMDNIIIEAYYPRKRSAKKGMSLTKLFEDRDRKLFYSILDKNLGDTVKYFRIYTLDHLGRDFQSSKVFIVKLEAIAQRFLQQVMVNIH